MVKPINDYIIIEKIEKGRTVGGLILPENATETGNEEFLNGLVVAVSDGKRNNEGIVIPLSVKVGDKVLYLKHGPGAIKIEGKDYLLAREGGILAINN